jgi:hypothetical protein
MNHNKLVCDVGSISYNFDTKVGVVNINNGCTDQSGAIELFQNIDPEVCAIYTLNPKPGLSTYYFFAKKSGWVAIDPDQIGNDELALLPPRTDAVRDPALADSEDDTVQFDQPFNYQHEMEKLVDELGQ